MGTGNAHRRNDRDEIPLTPIACSRTPISSNCSTATQMIVKLSDEYFFGMRDRLDRLAYAPVIYTQNSPQCLFLRAHMMLCPFMGPLLSAAFVNQPSMWLTINHRNRITALATRPGRDSGNANRHSATEATRSTSTS